MPTIFDSLPSTQTELKNKLERGEPIPHLDYVLAQVQTSGIARQGRSWLGTPGNLYLSFWLAEITIPLTWVPHWVALGLRSTLLSYGAPAERISIKWPNDLLVDENAKLAGILCEKWGAGVVVGIGVNLLDAPELSDRATLSLKSMVPNLNTDGLNLRFAESFINELRSKPGLSELRRQYEAASLLKSGQALCWQDLQTDLRGQGKFLRYGLHGELICFVDGLEKALYSEEIQLVIKP